jgi:ABC-type transporter MlaC component
MGAERRKAASVNRRLVLATLAGALMAPVLPCSPALAVDDGAAAFIEDMTQNAVGALVGTLPRRERAQIFGGLIHRYLDIERTSADLLGRSWARTSQAERERFGTLLVDYMLAVWGDHLGEIPANQKFMVTRSEPLGDRTLVHSMAVTPDDDRVPVDWLIGKAADGRPVLADVAFAGISLIRMMRADFTSVLFANSGRIDALFAAMTRKVELAALN